MGIIVILIWDFIIAVFQPFFLQSDITAMHKVKIRGETGHKMYFFGTL